jgi:hypothetical protein
MELSAPLIVGFVLLVIVVGLALWQRTQQVDRTVDHRPAGSTSASAHASAAANASDADEVFVSSTDPVIGPMTFDQDVWTADDDVEFAGTTVIVEVRGTKSGLTDAQRDILRVALEQQHELDTRARATIRQELDRQGIGETDMEAYELGVRPRDDGREAGFLWYDVTESDREMGVSSTDRWQTLKVETFE